MSAEKFESILYEVERGRARITLNRPAKRNALSFQLMSELHEALWEAEGIRSTFIVSFDYSSLVTRYNQMLCLSC